MDSQHPDSPKTTTGSARISKKHQRFRVTLPYLAVVAFIYAATAVAWLYLGAVTANRSDDSDYQMRSQVGQLWGGQHTQRPPQVTLARQEQRKPKKAAPAADCQNTAKKKGKKCKPCTGRRCPAGKVAKKPAGPPPLPVACLPEQRLEPSATRATAKLELEHRRKGLLWYSTYSVGFHGRYTLVNPTPCLRIADLVLPFPARGAIYDEFELRFDGKPLEMTVNRPDKNRSGGGALARITMQPEKRHTLEVRYRSRGLDRWHYALGDQTARARDFALTVTTNFDQVDFAPGTLSPSAKKQTGDGWALTWRFSNLLADAGIAVTMPRKLNPGPLSAEISRFAPVSLFFFFFVLLLVSVLRQVRLHPVHYGMLAAAFFSFHLLLAYLVDHLPLSVAFALASVTSVGLVVSYLRLAVGAKFALLWAGGAQLLYLVLFSLAFFLEGYTGLTITIFSILTLFVVMQLTGRIDWTEAFGRPGLAGPGGGTDDLSNPPVSPGTSEPIPAAVLQGEGFHRSE